MSKERELLKRLLNAKTDGKAFPLWIVEFIDDASDILATPETEPEPVAWMYDVADIDDGEIEKRLHFYKPLDCVDNIKNVMPLYTSPQQKPLDELVIESILDSGEEVITLRWFAREIEKAHNIT